MTITKQKCINITKDKRGLTTSYYIDPNGCEAQKSVVMPASEAAFYLCYNLKFYGLYIRNLEMNIIQYFLMNSTII